MRQLLPEPLVDVDPMALVADEARAAPPDRPWLLVNMVTSLDGATAVAGRSGDLGGPGDRRLFTAIRAVADVILVGASTVRAEGYRLPQLPDAVQEARVLRGQAPLPRLAIVSASLSLDLAGPLFSDSEQQVLVVTTPAADRARRTQITTRADLLLAGQTERVDFAAALRSFAEMGARIVVAEGGPSLNGQLLDADLVDEWRLTIAPLLVGGSARRAIEGSVRAAPEGMRLDCVLEEDGSLFLRCVRR
jgi:riboflavin-specific deaminase-like protein